MSRSNTHYYNLCIDEIGEDGYCDRHRPRGRWTPAAKCIPPGKFLTRRGLVVRKPRYPKRCTWKSWCQGPPHSIKRIWERKIRSKYRAEMVKRPDDPELFDAGKWLAGQYEWWS